MSERTYEHTVDLDQLVATAAAYEKVISDAQESILSAENPEVIDIANRAADALELQQRMFYALLPSDLREEFWDALEAAVKQPAGA